MLPTFLVIGAMKSGTTSLAQYIGAHPQCFVTVDKEPNFFSRQDRYALGQEWYESLFVDAGGALARGEASTAYTKFPRVSGVPERVAAMLPQVRLVYIVRNPIERLQSHYYHQVLRGKETLSLAEAIDIRRDYLSCSRYGTQLDQYLQHFDREQLLVITSDRLRATRTETMARVYEFIGVDPDQQPVALEREFHSTSGQGVARTFDKRLVRAPGRALAGRIAPERVKSMYRRLSTRGVDQLPYDASLSPELRRRLEAELHDDVRRLRDFLGDDFDGWGIG